MTSEEKKYDTSQIELLSIFKAVEHFKQFLHGKEFVIKKYHHPLISITTKSQPSVRSGRWLSELAEFKIEHKKGTDNIIADAISRLKLPNCDEEDTACTEKIINSVGFQYDPDMEILKFHDTIEAREKSPEGPGPVELNSFEFFIQALSYFEGEVNGTLGSSKPSPESPVKSADSRFEINSVKSEILSESRQYGWNQLLESATRD